MSNYVGRAINPRTNQVQEALFIDDHFGRHRYGIRFAGEEYVWPAHKVTVVTDAEPILRPQDRGEAS